MKSKRSVCDGGPCSCVGKGKSICPRTGVPCSENKSTTIKHFATENGAWYMPQNLSELLKILKNLPDGSKYRLVGGNTGTGKC